MAEATETGVMKTNRDLVRELGLEVQRLRDVIGSVESVVRHALDHGTSGLSLGWLDIGGSVGPAAKDRIAALAFHAIQAAEQRAVAKEAPDENPFPTPRFEFNLEGRASTWRDLLGILRQVETDLTVQRAPGPRQICSGGGWSLTVTEPDPTQTEERWQQELGEWFDRHKAARKAEAGS